MTIIIQFLIYKMIIIYTFYYKMYKLENNQLLISLFILLTMIYLQINQNISTLSILIIVPILIYVFTTALLFLMNCGYESV